LSRDDRVAGRALGTPPELASWENQLCGLRVGPGVRRLQPKSALPAGSRNREVVIRSTGHRRVRTLTAPGCAPADRSLSILILSKRGVFRATSARARTLRARSSDLSDRLRPAATARSESFVAALAAAPMTLASRRAENPAAPSRARNWSPCARGGRRLGTSAGNSTSRLKASPSPTDGCYRFGEPHVCGQVPLHALWIRACG